MAVDQAEQFVDLCSRGDLEGVRAALQRGFDVNSKWSRQTGLMKALQKKHIAVISLLLEQEGIEL